MDLQSLTIENLIIHRVPRKPEDPQQQSGPRLSEIADPQTDQVRGYFKQRLQNVMIARGQDVEPDPGLDAEVTDAIKAILADPDKLVAQSQVLAQRLYKVQDRRSPEGILVVALGKRGGRRALGLLKLEHERGVRAEEESQNGQLVFKIVLHEDLMLTQKTAVFKAGFFQMTDGQSPKLEALASDLQVEQNVASFFLEAFLGCRLVKKASVRTQDYFQAVEGFIGTVPNPERRARYEIALLNQMHSSGVKAIDPVQFGNDNLVSADRPGFRAHLKAEGVGEARFPKDTTAIDGRIKRMAYEFDSGIKVMGTPEAMKEHVEVDGKDPEEPSTVTVRDRMSNVHARG